jgi:hypothetical protein
MIKELGMILLIELYRVNTSFLFPTSKKLRTQNKIDAYSRIESTNKTGKRTKTQGQALRRQRCTKVCDSDTNILGKDASSKIMKPN